jgi:hypothetical protein
VRPVAGDEVHKPLVFMLRPRTAAMCNHVERLWKVLWPGGSVVIVDVLRCGEFAARKKGDPESREPEEGSD